MKTVLQEEDYYLDSNSNMVFTEIFHKKRGFCCKSGCRHCPFGFGESIDSNIPTEFLCKQNSDKPSEDDLANMAQELLDKYGIE